MKIRFLVAVVLAVLVAGVWLGRSENEPVPDRAIAGAADDRVQGDSADALVTNGPGAKNKAGRSSVREPGFGSRQQSDSSPADEPVSRDGQRPSSRTSFSANIPSAAESSEDERDGDLVIGGMVLDEDGNTLSGIEVLARRIDAADRSPGLFDQLDEGVLSVYSDGGGKFVFWDLEDGTYQLRIAPAEDIVPELKTVRVGLLNVQLVVSILWDIRVHGTVVSTSGRALENVRVNAGRQTRPARTGARGEYEVAVGMQGVRQTQFVHFRRDGYRDEKRAIDPDRLDFRTTELRFDVTMEPHGDSTTVTGSLTDTGGRAVPNQTLTMASSSLRTSYQARSDRGGRYAFEKVEPGRDYRLQIRPGSVYQDKDINRLEVPGGGLELDIVLEPIEQGQLSGLMIDPNANPVSGFALNLHSRVVAGKSVRVRGDGQGFFRVQDFPVGDAVFSTNSYPVFSVQGIRVSARSEDPIMVILDVGNQVLEGRVTDSRAQPVAGASVLLTWTFTDGGVRSASSRKTAADQDGYFVFTGIGPGVHRMQVSAEGFRTTVEQIDVGTHPRDIVVELQD